MKVFFDTNVLVSAFATRGLCADLFRFVLVEHEFVTGEVVIEEFVRNLSKKFTVPEKEIADILRFLRQYPIVPKPTQPAKATIRDSDDLWVLASAFEAQADVFLTGDHELLELGRIEGMPIMDPRGFWELLKK